MSEKDQVDRCRSVSPTLSDDLAGVQCEKPRGHKRRTHSNPAVTKKWEDGIKRPAHWIVPDDGYRSEGEYHAMRQTGVRW